MLDEKQALELLRRFNTPEEVIKHCETVHEVSMDVVDLLRERRPHLKINKRLASIGSLLHDIGRSKVHGLSHGVEGAKIIRSLNIDEPELEKIARICEVHIGAGIDKKTAAENGLPPKDYIPKTIEEKIISYSDNMVEGSEVRSPQWCASYYENKFGKDSDVTRRIIELNRFFDGLLK
ncbi:MAG: HDIG domain-containing protein [Candidatus Altiarchaeota archaeon]|nr:HDIG domain-containing protein [Candidatus Altiarchaeota archaeon]